MTAAPPIYTFAADNPETPARIRYAAAMDQSGPGMHWICFGATREEARDKLKRFWDEHEGPNKTAARKANRPDAPAEAQGEAVAAAEDEDVI